MKKILALLLIFVCCLTMLTACSGEMIGDFDYNYKPQELKSIDLNMYIIGNPETATANTTVANAITAYTARTLKINLAVHYISADEYKSKLLADVADTNKSVDIMLITDKDTFDTLYNGGYLACLTDAYNSREFGTLNAKLPDALLDASVVHPVSYVWIDKDEAVKYNDKSGAAFTEQTLSAIKSDKDPKYSELVEAVYTAKKNPYDVIHIRKAAPEKMLAERAAGDICNEITLEVPNDDYYTVPNSRTLGEYKYLVIDRTKAHFYHYSDTDLRAMSSFADAQDLCTKISNDGEDPSLYVYETTGIYADKAKLEAQGKICNVISKPTVTTEDAFASAFAISSALIGKTVDENGNTVADYSKVNRAMNIIFALHNDLYLRNLLQYGVKNTNYEIDDNNVVTRFDGENTRYEMNLLYTGAYDMAYYCEALGHTKATVESAKQQNSDATFTP